MAIAAALACAVPAQATDYYWGWGNYSGTALPGTVTIDDTLTLGCWVDACGTKILNTDLLNNGSLIAADNLYFYYGNTLTNNWQIDLRGDVGLYDLYGNNWLVNNSGLVKTQGAGASVITINSVHSSSAVVDAMVGTIDFRAGQASFASGAILMAGAGAGISFSGGSASFADGVRFTGAGQYTMAANASFLGRVGAQQLAFRDATWTGGDGSAGSRATLTSDAVWTGNGTLAGQWQTAAGTTLSLQGAGTKFLGYGAGWVNQGTVDAQDHLHFYYASTLLNQGRYQFNGDVGLYEAYGASHVVNEGTLAKVAGTGLSNVAVAYTSNGGTVDVQSGTVAFTAGAAFNDGSRFTGAGRSVVSSNARFNGEISSQNLVLADASWTGGDGSPGSRARLSGTARWEGNGTLAGQWETAAGSQMTLAGAGSKFIGQSATWVNNGAVDAQDHLHLYYASSLVNNGIYRLNGDVGLYETYGASSVVNNGTVTKTDGLGSAVVTTAWSGGGNSLIDVQQGTVDFAAGWHSFQNGARLQTAAGAQLLFSGGSGWFEDGVRFTGAGQVTMAANASFLGRVGAQQLAFRDATWTGGDGSAGSHATLTSDAVWTGNGTLAGQWQTAAGTTLSLQGAGTKFLGYGAGWVNQGTVDAQDHLHFYYASTLLNQGRYQFNGDVGLYEAYGASHVVNEGTLAKVAGTGLSNVAVAYTSNGGTVDVQSGTVAFTAGAAFNDGSRFTGAGRSVVSSNARFNGEISSQNLVLADASWTGGDGSPGSRARLSGTARWEGNGTLAGQWETAAGSQMTLAGAGSKFIGQSATWVNNGAVDAQDHLHLYYASSLVNNGSYRLNGDVGLYETYGASSVVNNGTIIKTGGEGTSQIAVAFANHGTVEVQSGAIRLPDGFVNEGVLQGTGRFEASQLVNAGHVGPRGSTAATLTLAGNFSQLASGSLDIGLTNLAHSDRFAVQGNALLDGTLALTCLGPCSFAAGADILVLDATGSLSGQFANVTLTGFKTGAFNVVYDAAHADVWLHVNQNITAAVPEPESYALFLAGLGLLGVMGRRRSIKAS